MDLCHLNYFLFFEIPLNLLKLVIFLKHAFFNTLMMMSHMLYIKKKLNISYFQRLLFVKKKKNQKHHQK